MWLLSPASDLTVGHPSALAEHKDRDSRWNQGQDQKGPRGKTGRDPGERDRQGKGPMGKLEEATAGMTSVQIRRRRG